MNLINMKEYPLASFCLVAYNQEKYIKEAVDAALNQDYPNLEIILSDDNSSDATYDIMSELASNYKGPHKVILNRNNPNLGPREHCNKLLYEISQGEFLFLAAGDDISVPNRVTECVEFMVSHPEVSSMSCKSQIIDENSNLIKKNEKDAASLNATSIFSLADYLYYDFYIFSGDSRVLRRSVINAFPPLKYPFAEDIFFFVRSFYVGSIAYTRRPLVLYRVHSASIMGKSRSRKAVDAKTRERFDMTKKQLLEDFEYAISKGYISQDVESVMRLKLDRLLQYLTPRDRRLLYRIPRVGFRYLAEFCKYMEYKF